MRSSAGVGTPAIARSGSITRFRRNENPDSESRRVFLIKARKKALRDRCVGAERQTLLANNRCLARSLQKKRQETTDLKNKQTRLLEQIQDLNQQLSFARDLQTNFGAEVKKEVEKRVQTLLSETKRSVQRITGHMSKAADELMAIDRFLLKDDKGTVEVAPRTNGVPVPSNRSVFHRRTTFDRNPILVAGHLPPIAFVDDETKKESGLFTVREGNEEESDDGSVRKGRRSTYVVVPQEPVDMGSSDDDSPSVLKRRAQSPPAQKPGSVNSPTSSKHSEKLDSKSLAKKEQSDKAVEKAVNTISKDMTKKDAPCSKATSSVTKENVFKVPGKVAVILKKEAPIPEVLSKLFDQSTDLASEIPPMGGKTVPRTPVSKKPRSSGQMEEKTSGKVEVQHLQKTGQSPRIKPMPEEKQREYYNEVEAPKKPLSPLPIVNQPRKGFEKEMSKSKSPSRSPSVEGETGRRSTRGNRCNYKEPSLIKKLRR